MIKKTITVFLPNMAFIGCLLIVSGFIIADKSPAPQSIGVAFIFLHPFFNGGLKAAAKNIYQNSYAAVLAFYYLLIILSIFHFGNITLYKQWVVMQLPLILIPFGLSNEKTISVSKRNMVFATLVAAILVAGIASFINYIIHFQEIQESITHSKPIPIITGVNHIYYSVLLAFSAGMLLWFLFIEKIQNTFYKYLALISLVIIIILLHTISARTGLICFYAEAAFSILWLMFKSKKILAGLSIGIALALFAIIAVKLIPSESNRFDNTKLDLHRYESGDNINHYSVSMRFEALKVGWKVFEENILTGVGPANVPEAMNKQYAMQKSELIGVNRIKPHNEFLYALVSMGIIGGIALCFMIFLPVFNGAVFRNYLLLMFIVVILTSFQVEYLLERQVGITFFCLFYIILSNDPNRKQIAGGIPGYSEILNQSSNYNNPPTLN